MTANGTSPRVDWVDYAKGICIVMVVMMHSVLGVEAAAGANRLHACGGDVRQAVPDARFLPDFRAFPGQSDRPRLAHLSRPQGGAFRLLLRAVGDDPVRLQGPQLRRRAGLGACRIRVSGILHRAVRYALVHLPAADLLRRHKTDTQFSADSGVDFRRRAGDDACRDRLDRDRRVLRALRLHHFRLSVRRLRVRAIGSCARVSDARARRARDCGRSSMAALLYPVPANCRSSR